MFRGTKSKLYRSARVGRAGLTLLYRRKPEEPISKSWKWYCAAASLNGLNYSSDARLKPLV